MSVGARKILEMFSLLWHICQANNALFEVGLSGASAPHPAEDSGVWLSIDPSAHGTRYVHLMHHSRREMQKSQVLQVVQAHELVFFARIPYQKVHRNIASAEGASEEMMAIF